MSAVVWPPRCDRCGAEITEPAALVFGPPTRREGTYPVSMKMHVCGDCWLALAIWFRNRGRQGYSPETIAAYEKVIETGFNESARYYIPTDAMLVALRNLATMVHCDLTGELREPHAHTTPPDEDTKWIKLQMGNDWGTVYLSRAPYNRLRCADHKRKIECKEGEPIRVRLPDGTVLSTTISMHTVVNPVFDHGHSTEVRSEVPGIKLSAYGIERWFWLNEVEVEEDRFPMPKEA